MRRVITLTVTVLMLLGLAAIAVADDFMPPPWRDGPLTVMAEWDFVNDFNPDPYNIDPDYLNTVGDGGAHQLGTAYTHCHADEFVSWEPDPSDPTDGIAATHDFPGELAFFLVNWIDDYEYKHIWVQITYGGQGVPGVFEVVGPDPVTNGWENPTYGAPVESQEVDPIHRVEYWILSPNPDREFVYIHIPPYTYVDQVVIDTISTNEVVGTTESTWGQLKAMYR